MVKKTINPNYEEAQSMAYKLIKSYSLIENFTFPIDPKLIIQNTENLALDTYSRLASRTNCSIEDITRITGSNDGISFYDPTENKYVITYNDLISAEHRKRFTIAHELGHIYLNHLTNEHLPKEIYEQQEKEANYFAKRFLVPLPFLTTLLKNTTLDALSKTDISFIFNVSPEVAQYSILNYNRLKFPPIDDKLCIPYVPQLNKKLSYIQIAHNFMAMT